MQFQDRVALVTGAGRGIGKAIALRLAQEGADLAVFDLDPEGAKATADEITALGRRAVIEAVDVSHCGPVQAAIERAAARLGRLDICINNAGVAKAQPFLEITPDNWDLHLKVHLYGSFFCAQAAAREMRKRRYGRIVNIASVAALMGPIDLAAYGAAKAGVLGMTRAAALELADHGITVNAVAPGPIETDLLRVWPAEALRERAQHQPVARLGGVDEVARAALFLCAEASGYINGTTLTLDGGAVGAGAYMVEKYRRRKAAD